MDYLSCKANHVIQTSRQPDRGRGCVPRKRGEVGARRPSYGPPPVPAATDTPALDLLRRLTRRDDAEFRDGQLEAIERLVEGRGRVLCV